MGIGCGIKNMKKISEFFVKKLRKPPKNESVILEFLGEVEKYRTVLEQAYVRILGKDRARKLLVMEKQLLSPDSYRFEISDLNDFSRFGFSPEEYLLFYVVIDSKEVNGIKIDSKGKIEGNPIPLRTSPFFFLNPETMKNYTKELKRISIPPYLTLWTHEYGHFM